jgi:hypothetical protein
MLKSVLGNSHWFFFKELLICILYASMWESGWVFFFFLNRGLTRTIVDIKKFPKEKNPVLRLGSAQQFENSRISWPVLTSQILNFFSVVYKSIISSLSKAPSNCSNFSSKFLSISITSQRLEGDFQPTVQSLSQFFVHKK